MFVASLISVNVCAQETLPEGGSGGQIDLSRDERQSSYSHEAHKSPVRRESKPSVYYDSYAGTLTFLSTVSISFVYNVYDEAGFIVCQGIINLEENQNDTISIPAGVEGECTITLEINGQTYSGRFYV